jgi:integrase
MPRKHKRVRVEPGLHLIGDVYWACATPTGARQLRWLKIGAVGVQEARRRRDEFAYKLKHGQLPLSSRRVTVWQLADEWFRHLDELVTAGQLRPRTVESYRTGIKLHVLPALGSRQVSTISPDDLVAWYASQRRSGSAAWSIRARWVPLRSLLGYAARNGLITANPADVLRRRERPKLGRPRDRFLTSAEIEALLSKSRGSASLIVPLLLFSGLRIGELLGLTWGDIDFGRREIRVRYQMSRKGNVRIPLKTENGRREVILMAEVAHRLRKARLAARFAADGDLIISNGLGRTLGHRKLSALFATTRDAAGLEGVTPHTCRHTFASILIDQGRTVEFVSQQLGHASTKTTWDTYVHLFRAREHAEAARRDLDAAFGRMLRAADDRFPPEP